MPESFLPCFNSLALECCLHQIPDLAEHFIYANDDMFVGRKLNPSFFFNRQGNPIVRLLKNKPMDSMYWNSLLAVQEHIIQRYTVSHIGYEPHHNMDAYTKTMLAECGQEFSELFQHTIHQTFRNESCQQRHLFLLCGLVKELTVLKEAARTLMHRLLRKLRLARLDSSYIPNCGNLQYESSFHPALF